MGFFRTLLGKGGGDTPAPSAIPPPAPTSAVTRSIGYDPRLVDSLLHDHAELGTIFARIGELQSARVYGEMRALLVNFKSRLEAHVLTENVRFYNYLEQALASEPNNAEIMRDFRREMNVIARSVIDFVKKYQQSAFNTADQKQFAADYAAVGKMLEQRLDSEENNLYPLYRPG
jgi:hemerythrin-like domain-containing protein